jgi:hypothetical protein
LWQALRPVRRVAELGSLGGITSVMRASLPLNLLTATALAFVAGYYAIFTIRVGGIHSSSWTDADLIRDRCPVRLIQPEWVSSQPDTLMSWCVAEMGARFGLIATLWLVSVIFLVWRHRRNRKHIHAA